MTDNTMAKRQTNTGPENTTNKIIEHHQPLFHFEKGDG
jgi:hypothetical protein